ncbi:MAG: hypothetical protein QM610_06000 [Chitinophagaceae bacterium]
MNLLRSPFCRILTPVVMFSLLAAWTPADAQQKKKQTKSTATVQESWDNLKGIFRKKEKTTQQGDTVPDGTNATIAPGTTQIAVGYNFAIVLRDSNLYAWGDNRYISLAKRDMEPYYSPMHLGVGHKWKKVAARSFHRLAIRDDGSLWGWGWGNYGELGLGEKVHRADDPTRVGHDTDWVDISTDSYVTMALKKNGTLWVWGTNSKGSLIGKLTGNSTVYTPTQIGHDSDWTFICAGIRKCYAIKKNGTLWSWGFNTNSDILGLGAANQMVPVPTQVGHDADWQSLFVSHNESDAYQAVFAIKKNGSTWVWGANHNGKLGLGSNEEIVGMTQLSSRGEWKSFNILAHYVVGLKKDGSLWACGDMVGSYIGDNSNLTIKRTTRFVPVRIKGKWSDIRLTSGLSAGFAILADENGRFYGFGLNDVGQLGQGKKTGILPLMPIL